MTEYIKDDDTWKHSLTAEDFLALTTQALSVLQAKAYEVDLSAEVKLKDGSELKAQSTAELTHDLENVRPHEIKDLQIYLATEGVTTHLRSQSLTPGSSPRTTLTTRGADHADVYGLHGQLERAITKHFNDLAEARRHPEVPQTSPGASTAKHWWNNNWLVAVVGGAAAAILGTVAIAWLFGSRGVAPADPAAKSTMVPYHGLSFTAKIPADWRMEENEIHKSTYVSNVWHNPLDPSETLLIDLMHPAAKQTLKEDASQLEDTESQTAGYQALYAGPGYLSHNDSWRWEFSIPGHQEIDYFLDQCDTDFAVLGSAAPSEFAQMRATTREVAQSLRATCP
jgi:hypothetical protein